MSITVTSGEGYMSISGQTDTGDVVDFGGGLTVFPGGTIISTTVFGAVDVQGGSRARAAPSSRVAGSRRWRGRT